MRTRSRNRFEKRLENLSPGRPARAAQPGVGAALCHDLLRSGALRPHDPVELFVTVGSGVRRLNICRELHVDHEVPVDRASSTSRGHGGTPRWRLGSGPTTDPLESTI